MAVTLKDEDEEEEEEKKKKKKKKKSCLEFKLVIIAVQK
jgi:hypothetical protein